MRGSWGRDERRSRWRRNVGAPLVLMRLAASLVLAGTSMSAVACGPVYGSCVDINGKTGIPVDEPVDWAVTLCLDDDCSTIAVRSDESLKPDVSGSLFSSFNLFRDEPRWRFQAVIAFGERTGEMRVLLEIRDHRSGELVLRGAVDHLEDEDHDCLRFTIEVGAQDRG
jgi:hypothetical protein